MTRDEIIEMAREAGIPVGKRFTGASYSDPSYDVTVEVARFAALVAAKERDACVKVCQTKADRWAAVSDDDTANALEACAVAIRARSR